jgi:hypothetical protein
MCHRVNCKKCGKPTWAGCGAHVEEALRGVAKADRCRCREAAAAAKAAAPADNRPWWSKVLGN